MVLKNNIIEIYSIMYNILTVFIIFYYSIWMLVIYYITLHFTVGKLNTRSS